MNTITKCIIASLVGFTIGVSLPASADERDDTSPRIGYDSVTHAQHESHMYQSGFADAVSTCLSKGKSDCLLFLEVMGDWYEGEDIEPRNKKWQDLVEYRYGYAQGVLDALAESK